MTDLGRARCIRAPWGGIVTIAIAPLLVWQFLKGKVDSIVIVSANGRIEAVEIDPTPNDAERLMVRGVYESH